ncbi:MAG: transcriptional repressor [Akkermansia sp.]|nr:transcriptional repressor [Akkermansia sp.]
MKNTTTTSEPPRSMQTASVVKRAGLRMTKQRRAVVDAILASKDHPTAGVIYERAKEIEPGISLATIYNCLETMAKAGVINHLHFDNGPSRFCPNFVPHVHVLDDSNNKVIDVQLKPGLCPEDIFDLPEGVSITSMEACLRGSIPAQYHSHEHQ